MKNDHHFVNQMNTQLPTRDEIIVEIEKCQEQAIEFAQSVGLLKKNQATKESFPCKLNLLSLAKSDSEDSEDEEPPITNIKNHVCFKSVMLKNFADKFIDAEVPENSPYIEVYCKNGRRKVIKTSSLVWVLRTDSPKLSSDRLQRVRARYSTRKTRSVKKQKKAPKLPVYRTLQQRKRTCRNK